MGRRFAILLGSAALATAGCAAAQQTITTPEGAQMSVASDLAYKPGELSEAQLTSSARELFVQDSMNVFRRFPREKTAEMVRFYTEALALRSLSPIQLTNTQQMILTGVGSGQVKLAAGQGPGRTYDLGGGIAGGTGIRFFQFTYPEEIEVAARFAEAGFASPQFEDQGDGTRAALVEDPGGFPIRIVIRRGAKDHSDDGVGVGINVSDLARSRAFYRDFVGLDELAPIAALGTTVHPYRHKETTLLLYHLGDNAHPDNGSAGIQYVVRDSPMVDAKARHRGGIVVETPLNKLTGFDLVTVWLNDPDGVTNYFAQVGPNSRTARERD